MYRYLLFLVAVFFLFTSGSCPGECEQFFFPAGEISASVENPRAAPYGIGEELLLTASFSARQQSDNETFTISDNGGFLVVEMLRMQEDSMAVVPAFSNFEITDGENQELPSITTDDPSRILLPYGCSDGVCNIRYGFIPMIAGTYFLRLSTSFIDEVSGPFLYCVPPSLTVSSIVGGNNIPAAINLPLGSAPTSSFFFPPVDSFNQASTYYFSVQ